MRPAMPIGRRDPLGAVQSSRPGLGRPPLRVLKVGAVGGWAGLLLVVALAWSHPAAARTPASAARGSVVADSGFRPSADGYAFANYVNQAGRPNLGSGELRR